MSIDFCINYANNINIYFVYWFFTMKDWLNFSNKTLVREIAIILVIKVVCLMVIKAIWFDSPTIPRDIDSQVAEHIAGVPSALQESSR